MLHAGEFTFPARFGLLSPPSFFSVSRNGIAHSGRTSRYSAMVALRIAQYRDDVGTNEAFAKESERGLSVFP